CARSPLMSSGSLSVSSQDGCGSVAANHSRTAYATPATSPNPSRSRFISTLRSSCARRLPYDARVETESSVAPVEVAAAAPEALVGLGCHLLGRLFAGPGHHGRLTADCSLLAVHRLFEASLLFGLEQRMVVERVQILVVNEGHLVFEPRVPFLQLEVILDHLGEHRRCFNRH